MSEQVTRRHRAAQRPVTPLSNLTTAVSGHVGTLSRGGVVIAMSSGLVATLGLPAHALNESDGAESSTATLSLSAVKAYEPPARTTAPVTIVAPKSADVDFEPSSATVKAKPVVREVQETASRSSARTEVPDEIKVGNGTSARGSAVLAVAARYLGVRYTYGGTSPSTGFDCSGYTRYVFAQLGYSLPRTATQQMYATKRVSRSEAQVGDLVFFLGGSGASHVGIYAGNGVIYDAGSSGRVVQKRAIWTSNVVFGRVLG